MTVTRSTRRRSTWTERRISSSFMNDLAARATAVLLVTTLIVSVPATGECPGLATTEHGTVGRGATKQTAAGLILAELSRATSAGGTIDAQTSFLAAIDYRAYLRVVRFRHDTVNTENLRR